MPSLSNNPFTVFNAPPVVRRNQGERVGEKAGVGAGEERREKMDRGGIERRD